MEMDVYGYGTHWDNDKQCKLCYSEKMQKFAMQDWETLSNSISLGVIRHCFQPVRGLGLQHENDVSIYSNILKRACYTLWRKRQLGVLFLAFQTNGCWLVIRDILKPKHNTRDFTT